MKPFLIRHLEGQSGGRFPVWLMRQAGRYLPNYRAIRAKHSFWEMVIEPELTVQVSLTPLEYVDVDAIIFFSDILTLPHSLQIPITLKESIGPYIESPMRSKKEFEIFADYDPDKSTSYVGKALTQIRTGLDSEKALIGFAGAPWTVASYLVENQPKKRFETLRQWMHESPKELAEALSLLSRATARYLNHQIAAGVNIVQVFDTWASEIPQWFYESYYQSILAELFQETKGAPQVYFPKGSSHLLESFSEFPIQLLGVDHSVSLKTVDQKLAGKFSLQGNLDPVALLGSEANVRNATRELVEVAKTLSKPAIINLGHGIIRTTPVENVQAFVEEAKRLWK